MGGDPMEMLKDVGLNLVTGGLYSVGKAVKQTIDTGNPSHLLTQGFDLGLSAVGNELALEIGGPKAAMAFNAAGGALGAAGAAGAFSGLPGFAPGGGVAPLAATPSVGGVPEAAGGLANATPAVDPSIAQVAAAAPPAAPPVAPVVAAPPVQGIPVSPGADLSALNQTLTTGPVGNLPSTGGFLSPIEEQAVGQALQTIPNGAAQNPALMNQWLAMQDNATKNALLTGGLFAGGQILTGSLGGIFAGLSAEKKLALEQLIADRTQQQIEYRNRNNQYAPRLTFRQPTGLANS